MDWIRIKCINSENTQFIHSQAEMGMICRPRATICTRVARVRRLDGQRKKNRAVQRSTRKGSQVRRKPRSPTCRPQTKIHADGATQQCRRQVAECTQNWSKKYNPERKGEKANGNSLSTDHLCFPVVFVCQRTKKTCSVLKADSSA